MNYRELMQKGLAMSMDELCKEIEIHKGCVKVLEDIKTVRIKDGEKTPEMIKREQRKAEKEKAEKEKPAPTSKKGIQVKQALQSPEELINSVLNQK